MTNLDVLDKVFEAIDLTAANGLNRVLFLLGRPSGTAGASSPQPILTRRLPEQKF